MTLSVEVGQRPGVTVGIPVWSEPEGPVLALAGSGDAPDPARCRAQGFSGRCGQTLVDGDRILVGLGPRAEADARRWRLAAAALARAAADREEVALLAAADEEVGTAVAEGSILAAYRYDEFKSGPATDGLRRFSVVGADVESLQNGVRRGVIVAGAVCFARDLINTPPSSLPPQRLAELVVERLGAQPGVRVDVWDETRIAGERLGGLLGVARGSDQPPRLVWAEYQPAGATRHVVLVGKGITFDSGGLSLKTAEGMTTMKTDMSGSAIVMGAISAAAALEVPVKVTAIAPVTENMPGPSATKPGDVLTIRDGGTIEVLNTDAEGRLVLADALSLAAELAPDAIVDVATLTGAAVVALGKSVAALFGNDEALVERMRASGERVGEPLWPMPLPEEYADHIDSEVADMKNIGKPGQAGSIVAALLLARFVGDVPWAHLDIAGPARSTESTGYLTKGGTAFGVRTLLAFLAGYASD